MADSDITVLTEDTSPLGGDLGYSVDDPSGTPADKKIGWGALNVNALGPVQGGLRNGYISRSVSSNNLTVAIKTLSGSDPSASDPVFVRIGNTVRKITAALSVTKNAGTNWCNAGSSELATNEIDYFVYLGYNSTDGTVIGFSRIPSARVYGDFSATSTNEKYAGISTITNAASTDEYEVVGRFNATLSAGAGYTWSVPATSIVISRPIFETRLLSWAPTLTGYSANPSITVYSYQIRGDILRLHIRENPTGPGTSNSTSTSYSAPFSCRTITNFFVSASAIVWDNGAIVSAPGIIRISSGSNTVNAHKDYGVGSNWTSSGGKCIVMSDWLEYPI